MGNDDLTAERIGSLAHDGSYGLSCCHILMRAAVMPYRNQFVIRYPEVDSNNPTTPPLTQFARPLMRHRIVGDNRHRKHASRAEASGFRLQACTLDATQEFGGCEMHKSSHTSSICAQAP
jgi:hypothetical protein